MTKYRHMGITLLLTVTLMTIDFGKKVYVFKKLCFRLLPIYTMVFCP